MKVHGSTVKFLERQHSFKLVWNSSFHLYEAMQGQIIRHRKADIQQCHNIIGPYLPFCSVDTKHTHTHTHPPTLKHVHIMLS